MLLRRYRLLFPAVAVLLTLVTFLPSVKDDFLNWDDSTNFVQNNEYRGLGWTQLKWMWTSHLIGRYVPITWMTLGLDYTIWKMNPFGYHLTNVLFHAANALVFYFLALLLYRVAWRNSSPESERNVMLAALAGALIFAVHPLRVESVSWVTERRDVVSGLFYLLTILAYVRGFDGADRPIRRKLYWVSVAFFVLALLSKEIVVTLPVVLILLDLYPLRRLGPGRWTGKTGCKVWIEKVPFFALTIADTAWALYIAQHEHSYASLANLGWPSRITAAIYSLGFYLLKTIVPFQLVPFYTLSPNRIDPWGAPVIISALVIVSISVAAVALWRKFPALLVIWIAYAVTLFPVLGLLDNGPQITADRYSYLACLGWALLAGSVMLAWTKSELPWLLPSTAGAVVLLLFTLSWRQELIWRDSETLWTYTLATEPSFLAYVNMGNVLMDRGDFLWAADHFRRAAELKPDFPSAHLGLGGAFVALKRANEAEQEFRIALQLGQSLPFAENGLACALALEGKYDEAIEHFNEALRLLPTYNDARKNRQQVLDRKKKLADAGNVAGNETHH